MLFNSARAKMVMESQALDILLASTLENVFYLTGYWNEKLLVMSRAGRAYALVIKDELNVPSLVTSIADVAAIKESCYHTTRTYYFGEVFRNRMANSQLNAIEYLVDNHVNRGNIATDPVVALLNAISDRGIQSGTIGYDERGMPPDLLTNLRSCLPKLVFKPADNAFRLIRAVKTAEEVERIRNTVTLTEKALLAAMSIIEPGITEEIVIREFEKSVVGGGGRPLLTQIYFGRRGALGYLPNRNGVLQNGDIVRCDVCCMLKGYCSDMARNVAIGEPHKRIQHLHSAVMAAQDATIENLRPGNMVSNAFTAGIQAGRKAGINNYQRHHLGHGLGLDVYDLPSIDPHEHSLIECNMVFAVEAPYYEIGTVGLQPEDPVLVTKNGPEILTTMNRSLIVIE